MFEREAGVGAVSMHQKVTEMSLDPALVWTSCPTAATLRRETQVLLCAMRRRTLQSKPMLRKNKPRSKQTSKVPQKCF